MCIVLCILYVTQLRDTLFSLHVLNLVNVVERYSANRLGLGIVSADSMNRASVFIMVAVN